MASFFQEILEFIASTSGSLVYHLVIIFSIVVAYLSVNSLTHDKENVEAQQLLPGITVLLTLRLLVFLISLLTILGIGNSHFLLPPLDRTLNAISLIIIVWLWVFPRSSRRVDIGTFILTLMTIVMGVFTFIAWQGLAAGMVFSNTFLDLGWTIFFIVLVIMGTVFLIIRKPPEWEYGFSMFLILFIGSIAHIYISVESDYAGAIRLSQLAAFPILFTLSRRIIPATYNKNTEGITKRRPLDEDQNEDLPTPKPVLKNQSPLDNNLISSFFALSSESDPQKVCALLTQVISQTIIADLCLLLSAPDQNEQFVLLCGFDLIREESMGGTSISAEVLPRVFNAAKRKKILRLRSNSKSPDLKGFAEVLDLPNVGGLLAAPIITPDSTLIAFIVLLSPYSNRNWSKQDETFLRDLSPKIAQVLNRNTPKVVDDDNLPETEVFQKETEDLKAILENTHQEIKEQHATIAGLEALLLAADGSEKSILELKEENQMLQELNYSLEKEESTVQGDPIETDELRVKLQEAEIKIIDLRQSISETRDRIKNTISEEENILSSEQADVIASLAQDVRQPLSSIIGYTDLLMDESVGILGALQRKFLDRVKTSTDRINDLIDDLIQIAALDSGKIKFTPEPVSLSSVIDEAINLTSSQIREKEIILRVDLPAQLPKLHTDKDALQQILLHLIQNASASSPSDGEITLKAQVKHEGKSDQELVLLQVTDTGGGISNEDLPRVFSRLYRADNPLIEGVGDTGVGLSIAKTLTEALGGKIWVESDIDHGSTFTVSLPVSREININGQGDD